MWFAHMQGSCHLHDVSSGTNFGQIFWAGTRFKVCGVDCRCHWSAATVSANGIPTRVVLVCSLGGVDGHLASIVQQIIPRSSSGHGPRVMCFIRIGPGSHLSRPHCHQRHPEDFGCLASDDINSIACAALHPVLAIADRPLHLDMGDKADGGELKRVNSYQVGKPSTWTPIWRGVFV
jgi:hypothetical protein